MKKRIKFAVTATLIALLIAIAATAVGCGGKSDSSDKIAIKSSPRLEYLLGQDLDLSKGSISSTKGDKVKEIKLTASGVKVSGYDKNKLGKQTVTVSYGGQTCTFTVNVHGKIEAVDYIADYAVGETFNVSQGKLLIYREDGVAASSVRLNAADVTVNVSPFTQAGAATVTATYKGDTATIAVNVYAPESVKLHAPNKLAYKSHETELDLSGAYMTVTANSGNMVKRVPLTSDMTEGFDPAAATADNIATPLEQEVTVRYLGQPQTFTVKVTYSYVTYMRTVAAELNDVALDAIPAEKGEKAVAAIDGYFGMSADDKALVTQQEVLRVVRAAAVYGKTAWQDVVTACADTVTIDEKGRYTFAVTSTQAGAKADYDMLNAKKDTVAATANVLHNIVKEFAQTEITDGKTAQEYIGNVMSGDSLREIVDKLAYMLGLYDVYKNVKLTDNAAAVKATLDAIDKSDYKNFGCTDMYDAVSSWHTAGDMFDHFYAYCYANKDENSLKVVCRIKLFGDFATLYDRIVAALTARADLYDYTVIDTTDFMMRFAEAETFAASLAAQTDEKTKWLYEKMMFPFFEQETSFEGFIEYLRIVDAGYYANCRGALGDVTFDALWTTYTNAVNANEDDIATAAQDLLRAFVLASPSVQYAFLSSVYTTYNALPHYNALPEHALAIDASIQSQFTEILFSYYTGDEGVLSSANKALFYDLMTAAEDYALRYYGGTKNNVKIDYLQQFLAAMQSAQTKYAALGEADKNAFDGSLGYFYDKYSAIYAMYNADGTMKTVELGAWKDKFDALKKVVEDVTSGYLLIAQKVYVYGTFVSGYEYAQSLAAEILACDDETVKNAYYYLDYSDGKSFDVALYALRETYVNALNRKYLWQSYTATSQAFKTFMANASPVMQMFVNRLNNITDTETSKYYGKENEKYVKDSIDSFYALSAEEKRLFYALDYAETGYTTESGTPVAYFMYDQALAGYFGETANVATKVKDAAMAFLDWEYYDTEYEYYEKTETTRKNLDTAKATFDKLYGDLASLAKGQFDEYFGNAHDYYAQKYAALG